MQYNNLKSKTYYFNKYDLTDGYEFLIDKTFTYNQLKEVYRDLFEQEIKQSGDNETTFESWLYDNLKMHLIFEK